MARAVWTGSLSFGLVVVPVALYPAVQERSVRFHQFQRGTSDRVRMRRVNERTGDDVPNADIDKGFDLGGGRTSWSPPRSWPPWPRGGRRPST